MTKQKPNPKTPPGTVATMGELAMFCGVSVTTVKTWKAKQGFPIEPDGGYSPFRIGQWHAERMGGAGSNGDSVEGESDDDERIRGPASPMLEKIREEIWKLRRMERIEREKGLIKRDRVRSFVMRVAGLIRASLDRIQRQVGIEAFQMMVDVLDDVETETEREFRDFDDEDDESEEDEAVQD